MQNNSTFFDNHLQYLRMDTQNTKMSKSLYFVEERDLFRDNYAIFLALEQAYTFHKNTKAVYFRHFEHGLSPIPQIYIYDYTDYQDLSSQENELANIHRNMWNAGIVPFIYVFTTTEVVVINCADCPKDDTKNIIYEPFKILKQANEIQEGLNKKDREKYALFEEFSADRFDSGYFFENSDYKKDVQHNQTAYETLIKHLDFIKNKCIQEVRFFPEDSFRNETFVKKFLLMCILMKYLEERKDEGGLAVFPKEGEVRNYVNGKKQKKTFKKNFFEEFLPGASNFADILKNGKNGEACVALFDYLSKHFAGTVFSLDETEKEVIRNTSLQYFKNFVEGNVEIENLQINIWRLYSFAYLPVELISNIYEIFLERTAEGTKKAGVVYTPPFLVRMLVDQSMPLKKYQQEDFKILDPACGSGVFLVAAYSRMVQWWRIRNQWKKPDLAILKGILANVHGVDISTEAVNIAAFSLTITLLDMLSPKEIWDNLTFEKEEKQSLFNLHKTDFFTLINSNLFQEYALPKTFDLVIGNPPFVTFKQLGNDAEDAKKIDKANQNQFKERGKLPDDQVSLLFAEESIKLCKENGLLCMILPSGSFLYNNNSDSFRKHLLTTYKIPQVLDFTHIARVLFKNTWQKDNATGADVATLALFAKRQKPTEKPILHIVFKRIAPIEQKMYFELDKYDMFWLSKKTAQDRVAWKCNYLGGGRIYSIMNRLRELPTLKEFIDSQNDWIFQEGYIGIDRKKDQHQKAIEKLEFYKTLELSQLSNDQQKELKKLQNKYQTADFLTNKKTIPTKAFTEDGMDIFKCEILIDKYFSNPRSKKLFSPPHILIKEVVKNKLPIAIRIEGEFLSFQNSIVGISAPPEDMYKLSKLANELLTLNNLYRFFITCYSGRLMVNKATSIVKTDIEKLPYSTQQVTNLYAIEQVIVDDVLNHTVKFRSNGSTSEAAKPIHEDKQSTVLDTFQQWFCNVLNSVYQDIKAHKPIFIGKDFICYPFYKGEQVPDIQVENPQEAEIYLNNLLEQKNLSQTIRTTRIMTIFDKNVIYLVKPNQLRYWLPSVAIKDADEIFSYLLQNGY